MVCWTAKDVHNPSFFVSTTDSIPVVSITPVQKVDSHIQRIIVLATGETTVTQNKSAIDLSNVNPTCGHKEVRRLNRTDGSFCQHRYSGIRNVSRYLCSALLGSPGGNVCARTSLSSCNYRCDPLFSFQFSSEKRLKIGWPGTVGGKDRTGPQRVGEKSEK